MKCECCKTCRYFFRAFINERKKAGWKWTLAYCIGFFVLPVVLMSGVFCPSNVIKACTVIMALCLLGWFGHFINNTYKRAIADMNEVPHLKDTEWFEIYNIRKKVLGDYRSSEVTWLPHQFHQEKLGNDVKYAHLCIDCKRHAELVRQNKEFSRQNKKLFHENNKMFLEENVAISSQPSISSGTAESFSIEMEDVESSLIQHMTHRSRHPSAEPSCSSTFVTSAEVYRSNSDESS